MNNSGKIFSDEFVNWLIDYVGSNQSQCQMSIYHKYEPDGSKLVVLSYIYEYVFVYTYEELVKWFMDKLVKIFHVNFLGYTHWFISIIISQLKDHSMSVDHARYATSVVAKYLDTATIKQNSKFHKTALPHHMIFTK